MLNEEFLSFSTTSHELVFWPTNQDVHEKRLDDLYGCSSLKRRSCWFTLNGLVKGDKITGTSIGTLLQQFQGRGATDIRDRVYSLLGLASRRDREAIEPDYSESNLPSKLFHAVASHIFHCEEDPLQMLYYAGPCYNGSTEKSAHLLRGLGRLEKAMENLANTFEGSNKANKV
jgi:hypothetical protein